MPGRPQVSIRLATSGKGEVRKDFAEIGDVGSQQAQRYAAAWERASADAERALERQAKAAQRLASAAPPNMQQRINAATGVGAGATGAGASVSALDAMLKEAERDAQRLVAAVDPLFAAQQRYATNVARINELKSLGVLQGTRYAQLLEVEEQALDSATMAATRHAAASGRSRAGMQQLSFQAGDVAQQMALGTSAGIIFAQQSGQVVQAMQMMGGQGNKLLRFLGSPWGIAVSTAAVVLLPLIGRLLETGKGVDALVDKMRDQAGEAEKQRQANVVWANSLDGVREAIRKNREALDQLNDSGKTAARRAFEVAIAESEKAKRVRVSTLAILEQAEANLKNAQAVSFGAGGGAGAQQAIAFWQEQVDAARQQVTDARNAVVDADKNLLEAQGRRLSELFSEDDVEKIKRQYDDPRTGMIALAAQHASAEEQVNGVLKSRVELLKKERDAKVKAAEDAKRDPPANAGGTAIFDAQIASFFDTAAKYRGLSETGNKGVLEAFFREANLQLDPEKTAWCAAFVNAVLATNGVKGTGSLAASSFLNFGKDDTRSPQKGDIAVVKSGGSPSGQHVGFVESVDAKGNIRVLGGNTGDRVGSATYGKNDILAVRRPPTPSEAAKVGETAADRELTQQNRFEEQLTRLQAQLLQAEGENVVGAQARAEFARRQIDAEEAKAKQQIQNDLEEGKYGDATSKLAQERALQLTEAAAQTAAAKRTTQATQDLMRSLHDGDQRLSQLAQFHVDELQHQESIARTAGEQRKLQLEIIDSIYEEKQRHLEVARNLALMAGEYAEAVRIQDEINNLPKEKARDQDDARRGTRSPGEEYLDSLPKTMADLTAALESVQVRGLKDFNAGLREALMNAGSFKDLWHDLGDVVHNVAKQMLSDLLDLAIQMWIMRPIAQALFGGGGTAGGAAGGGGGGGSGSMWGTIISGIGSALGAIFGGGGGAPGGTFDGVGFGSNPTTGPIGMAVGTPRFSGGVAWVGENGPELVQLPGGSRVNTAAQSRRMAHAANDIAPRISLTNYNDFRGADAASVDAINTRLDAMEADLPTRVVSIYQDARSRFLIRS